MFEKHDKMVRYDHWCQSCKNKDTKENDDPCEDCLSNPVNETEKPLRFEEK